MAGYSGTPLVKKLGIKEGFNILIVNAPNDFEHQLELPEHVTLRGNSKRPLDFVVLFVKSQDALKKEFSRYAKQLTPGGMIPANTCTQRAMKLSHSLTMGLII